MARGFGLTALAVQALPAESFLGLGLILGVSGDGGTSYRRQQLFELLYVQRFFHEAIEIRSRFAWSSRKR